ncbi:MAG: ATP-dependent zinc metalloprotease FtsH [Verrucomicrobiota bacterium]
MEPPKRPKDRKPPVRKRGPSGPGGGPNGGGEDSSNWKGLLFFMFFIALALTAFFLIDPTSYATKEITTEEFDQLLSEKQKNGDPKITELKLTTTPTAQTGTLTGKYVEKYDDKNQPVEAGFRTPVVFAYDRDLQTRLQEAGFTVDQKVENTWMRDIFFATVLPLLLIVLVFWLIFRHQLRAAGKNAFSFGKSKARMLTRDRNRVTFKDVAGIDEAKEELSEIVDFLRDPRKFQKLGGRIPKGVLMIGPPGTGKTLLAKAIAGEADVPFFSISGSDFVEMFVGVGASRVRDMFEQGKKNAPCIIFIDEIDAVGRSRGTGMGGGHDEREQTLNAMLVEMDGMETNEGVIIIAATNRKDVLDPALLRPGRFDREVRVNLPDVKGRRQILEVHTKSIKIEKDVDLGIVARGTPGFSGAELANLVNEAALIAAKQNQEEVKLPDLEEARDKVRWGRERRSMAMTEEEKRKTAIHEAGHALLNVLLEHTDPLHKVTIIPRGPSLGVTMMLPEKDKLNVYKDALHDDICVAMGGRVAEEEFQLDVSSGAAGDIQMATHYARKMVCEWGMSDKLGMIHYGDDSQMSFLGRELGQSRSYSEQTAQDIDAEVHAIIDQQYRRAKDLIGQHHDTVQKITDALLEYETLDGQHIIDIVKEGEMKNPPPKPIPPPATPLPHEEVSTKPEESEDEDDGGMLPGLQGAPAGA